MTTKKLTTALIRRINADYRNGLRYEDLKRKYDVSIGLIAKALKSKPTKATPKAPSNAEIAAHVPAVDAADAKPPTLDALRSSLGSHANALQKSLGETTDAPLKMSIGRQLLSAQTLLSRITPESIREEIGFFVTAAMMRGEGEKAVAELHRLVDIAADARGLP